MRRVNVGGRLRRGRLRLNFTQEALAERLGTTARSVGRWESGHGLPRLALRERYAELVGIPAAALFADGTDTPAGQAAEDEERPWFVVHLVQGLCYDHPDSRRAACHLQG